MGEVMSKTLEQIANERRTTPELVAKADAMAKALGGPGMQASYNLSVCALCGKEVDPEREFRDAMSKKEWRITRCCQGCQDSLFAEGEDG